MNRIIKLSETIKTLMEGEFSGYIKINFSQGSLGRVEKSEEFDEAAILLSGRDGGKKKNAGAMINREALKAVPVVALVSLSLFGCAAGMARPPQPASVPGNVRVVRSGDGADIRYLCRLKSGEVAAATDPVPAGRPKSKLYAERKETGPLLVWAMSADEAAQAQDAPYQQRSIEEEIANQLALKVVGMQEGDKRAMELTAETAPEQEAPQFLAHLSRVRTREKELKITTGDYEYRTGQTPQVGQAYAPDPDFPGKVESVSDKEVTVRFFATPGAVIETPFGPGRVREEGPNYKMDIEAHQGALVRAGNMTGRISAVDDKIITLDFGNPFGGETLLCDVTVEKIADARPVKSGE